MGNHSILRRRKIEWFFYAHNKGTKEQRLKGTIPAQTNSVAHNSYGRRHKVRTLF
jgi:hypothetical protein